MCNGYDTRTSVRVKSPFGAMLSVTPPTSCATPDAFRFALIIVPTHFADAERHFKRTDRRQLRPALIMMHVYRRTLDRLIARGWRRLDDPVRLAKPERLWLALRYGLL